MMGKNKIKVAVLGAGASAGAGAPIISNFFEKIDKFMKEGKFREEEKEFDEVLEYRKEWLPNSNIEEFLSYLDFQSGLEIFPPPDFVTEISSKIMSVGNNCIPINNMLKQADNNRERLNRLRKLTISLISKTLNESLKIDEKVRKSLDMYKKLIKTFDVTISFNWDILYEIAYDRLNHENLKPSQLGIDRFRLCFPALLKMHGSFNWAFCKKCTLIISTGKFEHEIYADGKTCEVCNENELIPITIFLGLTKFQRITENDDSGKGFNYRGVWFAAMEALLQAEKIVFFGYSLPEADPHSTTFFKSMISKNKNPDLSIEVVRPDGKEPEDEQLKGRYKKAFGNRTEPVFRDMKFEDYFNQEGDSLERQKTI